MMAYILLVDGGAYDFYERRREVVADLLRWVETASESGDDDAFEQLELVQLGLEDQDGVVDIIAEWGELKEELALAGADILSSRALEMLGGRSGLIESVQVCAGVGRTKIFGEDPGA